MNLCPSQADEIDPPKLRLCRLSISNSARRLLQTWGANPWPPAGRERNACGPIGEGGRRKGTGTVGSDMARIGCVAAGAVTLYHSEPRARPSTRLSPRLSRSCERAADFQSDDQDHVGGGGTGTVEYLCSGGRMSLKAFNFGSCQDANNSPQTVHCARPGLPFTEIDSAT